MKTVGYQNLTGNNGEDSATSVKITSTVYVPFDYKNIPVQNEKYSIDTWLHYLSDLHLFSLTIQLQGPITYGEGHASCFILHKLPAESSI